MSFFVFFSVPLAALLAYLPHFARVAVLARHKAFDNRNPRDMASKISDRAPKGDRELASRLSSAHQNQMETLGLYAAGIAVAVATKTDTAVISRYATAYIVSRILYILAYAAPPVLAGRMRGLPFTAALASVLALWFVAANSFANSIKE